MRTLKTGCKAYLDAFLFGCIPCVVVSIGDRVTVKITASRGQYDTYKRGEMIETGTSAVFPRECLRARGRILAYTIKRD